MGGTERNTSFGVGNIEISHGKDGVGLSLGTGPSWGWRGICVERTRDAVFVQAGKMGLTETRTWQPDEDRVLSALYLVSGPRGVRERLPHRTLPAIKHRAKFLGLRYSGRKSLIISE
ncbi:hypothetical protein AA437_002263 [Salmonella enterica subsp. enterica]|nr:hypothetical protein [Salmonella enterica subsp. enterica]